jgi:hypothetical protein
VASDLDASPGQAAQPTKNAGRVIGGSSSLGGVCANGARLSGSFATGLARPALFGGQFVAALHFGPNQKGVAVFDRHRVLAFIYVLLLYVS